MNWVDIAILSIVVASTLAGLFWGLIRQVLSFVGLAGGIFIAGRFYQPVAEFLHPAGGGGLVADPGWAHIIAFAAVLIGFSLLLGIVGTVLLQVRNRLALVRRDPRPRARLGL